MNQQRVVQFAVMCLQELDAHAGQAVSVEEISQRRGIPLPECTHVIRQLGVAGIVELAAPDQAVLRRAIEDLTALEILQAVWTKPAMSSPLRVWLGDKRTAAFTREYLRSMPSVPPING